jgi:hypothetical protein
LHGGDLLLTGLSVLFDANPIHGGVACRGIEPTRERRVLGQFRGITGQLDENTLSDIGCTVRIAVQSSQGSRVDKSQVPANEFREGVFTFFGNVPAEKNGVIVHGSPSKRCIPENRTKILSHRMRLHRPQLDGIPGNRDRIDLRRQPRISVQVRRLLTDYRSMGLLYGTS